eukprot:sb/3476942/
MVMSEEGQGSDDQPRKRLKFRCYKPADETLQDRQIAPASSLSVDSEVKKIVEESKIAGSAEIDLNALAPRKENWDLKRDVEKKLAKLEKRTKRSMAEMIREKLKSENSLSAD